MKTRVVKGYNGLGEIFIPQYKRSFLDALLHWEFGWKYYYKETTDQNKKEKVKFYNIDQAISRCQKKVVKQQFQVVWEDDDKKVDDGL